MFATEVADGVLRAARPETRWLATGPDGGYRTADAAYNVTVPEGFDRTDVAAYAAERRREAGFDAAGPAMLTGVEMRHARRARLDGVEVIATVGLTNPAAIPVPGDEASFAESSGTDDEVDDRPGTVNLLVGTERALPDGTLATLLATAVEAKTATLQAATGFTGTTSDAVLVGCDPDGESARFAGSATPVGQAARVCVRDAILAGIDARYGDDPVPDSVADADHGTVTEGSATVSRVDARRRDD